MFRRALLCCCLGFPLPARAMPWYVEDETSAAELREALAALWPDAPVEVVVGETGEGLQLRDGELVLDQGGTTLARDAPDVQAAVALARAWSRDLSLQVDWVPTEDNYIPPPRDVIELAPEAEPFVAALYGGVGVYDRLAAGSVLDGVRLTGGLLARPRVAIETDLSVSLGNSTAASALDRVLLDSGLLALAGGTLDSNADLFGVSATAHWLVGPSAADAWRPGLRLFAGLHARQYVARRLSLDGNGDPVITVVAGATGFDGGPTAGLGLELRRGDVLTVSLRPQARMRLAGLSGEGWVDFGWSLNVLFGPSGPMP